MPDVPDIAEKAEYDRFDDDMLEQCPVCGRALDPRFHSGEVVRPIGPTSAVRYDHVYETEPEDGTLYCDRCWEEYLVEAHQAVNHQLTEYVREEDHYYGN